MPISDSDRGDRKPEAPVTPDTEITPITVELPPRTQVSGVGREKRKKGQSSRLERAPSPRPGHETDESKPIGRTSGPGKPEETARRKDAPLTRALRSHQLWLTLTYFALLILMARGLAG